MYYKKTIINGEFTVKHGFLSGELRITTVTIHDGIRTKIDTKLGMVYGIMSGNGWCAATTNVTISTIDLIPAGTKMIPVPKTLYSAVENIFTSRLDAGCEETPPTPAICAVCPCKEICDWLCTHEAI